MFLKKIFTLKINLKFELLYGKKKYLKWFNKQQNYEFMKNNETPRPVRKCWQNTFIFYVVKYTRRIIIMFGQLV